ncbi:MAG TPA: ATP-binding protein [Anaerolineales bacterium]|nr:ATP-binding protein [Anaerolineales bacterium]
MKTSLSARLALSHLAVIAVGLGVAAALLLTLARSYFLDALEESLAAQASLLAQALIPGATTTSQAVAPAYNAVQQQAGNFSVQVAGKDISDDSSLLPTQRESNLAFLNQVSVALSSTLESRFRVIDNRGIVLLDSAQREEGAAAGGEPIVLLALRGEQASEVREVEGQDWFFVSVPLRLEGEVAGAVELGQPLRDVAAVLADLEARLRLVLALALPLAALVGLALARTIARPIHALTLATTKLSQGDFEHPLEAAGDDELGQLGRAFAGMRDRLQAVERMRTQFVSDVSHELRTPLTAIKGLAETLRGGAADDPSVRDHFLASVEGETDRLIRLVNDLLTLSRADAQALTVRRQEVDLGQLARGCVDRLRAQAEANGVELLLRHAGVRLTVSADPDRIEQVIVNLLDNAFKHSPSGASVVVEVRRVVVSAQAQASGEARPEGRFALPAGEWCAVSVTDSGEGISAEALAHVFDRFYRAEPSRARDRGGSGLGLSIAKALVEAQGGHIWIASPAGRLAPAGGSPPGRRPERGPPWPGTASGPNKDVGASPARPFAAEGPRPEAGQARRGTAAAFALPFSK